MNLEDEKLLAAIQKVRQAKEVSMKDLALKIGVSPAYLSKLLNGNAKMKVDHLLDIASALGTEVEFLMCMAMSDKEKLHFRLKYPHAFKIATSECSKLAEEIISGCASESTNL